MRIMKDILGSRNTIAEVVELELVDTFGDYCVLYDGKNQFLDSKRLVETGALSRGKGYFYFYKKKEVPEENNNPEPTDEFIRTYKKAMDALEYQTKLVDTSLSNIKEYEKKIMEHKLAIQKVNDYTLACMKKLSEVSNTLFKEVSTDGEKDS